MDQATKAAIRAGNDVLAADDRGVAQNAVGNELRVFDKVGGMADDTWHKHLARGQLRLLPHPPLMLVPHIGGLEGIGLCLYPEDQMMMCSSGRSIERDAAGATALGQQLLLNAEVGRDLVRHTRALMIEIPARRSRQFVLARGKPGLSDAPQMKIVRR